MCFSRPDKKTCEHDMGLIHLSAGGGKFLAFFRRYFPFLAEKYGLRPARPGLHVRTFDAVCTPETDETPTDRQQQHRPQRRRRHGGSGIVLGCCRRGGDRAALVLAAPAGCTCCSAALTLRCLCLCLWLRLWATAAAAPLPVEDREEEAPRAHLRAGTQPARGSNPGRAAR